MMTKAHQQEAFCRAYIQAVAARCGMTWSQSSLDYGNDLTLNEVAEVGGRFAETGFKVDVQAKSTTRVRFGPDSIIYKLDVETYKYIRREKQEGVLRRILVLLVMPENESDWFSWSVRDILLRRCAYWLSLEGFATTSNTWSVAVKIPIMNEFSPDGLQDIMNRIRQGARL